MEYYPDLNALPHDPVFEVEFECKNCGKEFSHQFDANVEVRPAGVIGPNFRGIDEVSGNNYVAIIDGEKYPIGCENCDIDTSLYELNREPLNE